MATVEDETLWCATCAARAEYLRSQSDFRARAVKLCEDRAAECNREDMPASEHMVLELMAALEQL